MFLNKKLKRRFLSVNTGPQIIQGPEMIPGPEMFIIIIILVIKDKWIEMCGYRNLDFGFQIYINFFSSLYISLLGTLDNYSFNR